MIYLRREYSQGEFVISTDPSRLDLRWIHGYLTNEAYWAKGIQFEVFLKSVTNSRCYGVYHGSAQVGFGRVISDFATLAYLADVFIAEKYRGQGLGKWLVGSIMTDPELRNLRRWMLLTLDAHGLYEQYGFESVIHPENVMEKVFKEKSVHS